MGVAARRRCSPPTPRPKPTLLARWYTWRCSPIVTLRPLGPSLLASHRVTQVDILDGSLWGIVKVPLRAPDLRELRQRFACLTPDNWQVRGGGRGGGGGGNRHTLLPTPPPDPYSAVPQSRARFLRCLHCSSHCCSLLFPLFVCVVMRCMCMPCPPLRSVRARVLICCSAGRRRPPLARHHRVPPTAAAHSLGPKGGTP